MARRPSVLFFYPAFPLYRLTILQAVARDGRVDSTFMSGDVPRASLNALTAKEFPPLQNATMKRIGPFSLHRGVFSEAVSKDYDAVVVGPATMSLTTWAILLTRRLRGRRTLLWGRCGRPGNRDAKRFIQELMNRLATGLLVYGESDRQGASELGTPLSKIAVVYNATQRLQGDISEPDEAAYATKAIAAAETGQLVLTYVGRLLDIKRIDILYDVIEIAREHFPHVRVQIVGDGPARAALKEHAGRRALPVEFFGPVTDTAELRTIMDATTLVVSPHELGLLALDSIYYRVPILVPDNPRTNGPEVDAVTERVNGLRFRHSDAKDIVRAIRDWIALAPSLPESRVEEQRQTTLENWSAGKVAARIVDQATTERE